MLFCAEMSPEALFIQELLKTRHSRCMRGQLEKYERNAVLTGLT